MSCQFKDECPSYSGWCEGPKDDFSHCIPFIINAVKGARQENVTLREQLAEKEIELQSMRNVANQYKQWFTRVTAERDALRARQEQPNEPLTLEELRQMEGEPVWVKDLLIPKCSAWHFVIKHDGEMWLFDAVAFGRRILGYNATTGENYSKTWLAYRRKPEQEG